MPLSPLTSHLRQSIQTNPLAAACHASHSLGYYSLVDASLGQDLDQETHMANFH